MGGHSICIDEWKEAEYLGNDDPNILNYGLSYELRYLEVWSLGLYHAFLSQRITLCGWIDVSNHVGYCKVPSVPIQRLVVHASAKTRGLSH